MDINAQEITKRFRTTMSQVRTLAQIPDGYIAGLGRNVPHPPLAHLYKGTTDRPGKPMCRHGWNRSQDPLCPEYSIWRGNVGLKGICKTCMKRALAGLDGVDP